MFCVLFTDSLDAIYLFTRPAEPSLGSVAHDHRRGLPTSLLDESSNKFYIQVLQSILIFYFSSVLIHINYVLLLLLLLLKPAAQAQVGKNKLYINGFRNPASTCATENRKNTTQRSNQQLTARLSLANVMVPNTLYGMSFHIGTWAGFTNWDVLHLDTSNSNG